MADIVTVRQAVERSNQDGFPVSEYTLRKWIKSGVIPIRRAGNKALIFYPNLLRYIRCEDGKDNPTPVPEDNGLYHPIPKRRSYGYSR